MSGRPRRGAAPGARPSSPLATPHPAASSRDFSSLRLPSVGQSLARAEMSGIVARIVAELELTVEREGRVDCRLTVKPVGARLRARRVT